MRTTHVKPDTSIEHLDFTPTCTATVVYGIRPLWLPWGRRCRRPAKWMAVMPCCGAQLFACDRHRIAVTECGGCGLKSWQGPKSKWVRI